MRYNKKYLQNWCNTNIWNCPVNAQVFRGARRPLWYCLSLVITLQASPKRCKSLSPNVAQPPFQKQVNGTNKRRLALRLRNEPDQSETEICKPDSSLCCRVKRDVARAAQTDRPRPLWIRNACSCDIPVCHSSSCILRSLFPAADSREHSLLHVYAEHTAQWKN